MKKNATGRLSRAGISEGVVDVLLFSAALVFYMITLHPGVGGREMPGDAAKFQYIGSMLGVPHSPGYPLYVMINWAWSHLLPFVTLATRINLLSAVFASAALVVFRRGLAALGAARVVGIAATAGLALSGLFWLRATEAGPGAMSYLFVTVLFLCLIRWTLRRTDGCLWCALVTLFVAAGHETVCLWLVPVIVAYIVAVKPRVWLRASTWVACIAGIAIGYGVYAYVYIRSHEGALVLEFVRRNASLTRVLCTAFDGQFWPNYFYADAKTALLQRVPQLVVGTFRQFHVIGLPLSVIGVVALWRRSRAVALLFYVCTAMSVVAVIHLFTPDLTKQFWLFFLIAAYCCGAGLDCLWRAARGVGRAVLVLYVASLVLYVSVWERGFFNHRNPWDMEELLLACPEGSHMLTEDFYTWREVLRYYRHVNPFIRQRDIAVRDTLNVRGGATNVFVAASVKSHMDRIGIPYTPVYSNEVGTLYVIGRRRE